MNKCSEPLGIGVPGHIPQPRAESHGCLSLPTTGELPRLADRNMGPTLARRMDMALSSRKDPSTPMRHGQQFVVGQRLEMPTAIGAPSSSRNYMAKSLAHIQASGIFNAHRLPQQYTHPSVHGTKCGPEGLGQYIAVLMSEDADAHTHERAVAGRRRRVQGHTRFHRPPAGGRHS